MLEYILAKIISDEHLKQAEFIVVTKDSRRIIGKIVSVSNGFLIIEANFSGHEINEFVIIDKISAIELVRKFSGEEYELINKRIEKYLEEFEAFNQGSNSVASLIECIGSTEKDCIFSKYFLDGNHNADIKVEEYKLIVNEVSIFSLFLDESFNMLLLNNEAVNAIAIPEVCLKEESNKFGDFRYIKF
ncbi:hypothetical protein [uncultured Clostridium sp.]|uniref:hypothetical protein n=1 Tax=uncultured Clostridium sp. TaxID=59620 RepID=UPI0026040D33|nr:hypothetical protein [uncultured Clostridium sp.]